MKINTARFGEIELKDQDIIYFPEGIIGFPEVKEFIMLSHHGNTYFKWLQAVHVEHMAFLLVSPLILYFDYKVDVSSEELANLELSTPESAIVFAIVTVPSDAKKISTNLKAPLLFNPAKRLGKQVILHSHKYQVKHFITHIQSSWAARNFKVEQEAGKVTTQ